MPGTRKKWGLLQRIFEAAPRRKDRITRVGSHTGQHNLASRLREHYLTENHHRSIFRKHIGRALLHKRNDPYAEAWDKDYTSRAAKDQFGYLRDMEVEQRIEGEVSAYLRGQTSFAVLALDSVADSLTLEKKLLATLAGSPACRPSSAWLGLFHPAPCIQASGLWNVQGLKGIGLSLAEAEALEPLAVR